MGHKSFTVDITFVLSALFVDNSGFVFRIMVQIYGIGLLLILRIVDDNVAC